MLLLCLTAHLGRCQEEAGEAHGEKVLGRQNRNRRVRNIGLIEEQHSLPKEKRHFYRLISKCDTPQSRFGHEIKGWTVIGT